MKQINNYISEKLHISKKYVVKTCPKSKSELMTLIEHAIEEEGKNPNLKFIDTSQITNMSGLFSHYCTEIENPNISEWDVSNVADMSSMFHDCRKFEGKGLEKWDVSNVVDMSNMFLDCVKFNGDLSKWDVSNVENMQYMFNNCQEFEGKGIEKWDVRNVKNMNNMFEYCELLNIDLETWKPRFDCDMFFMFRFCSNLTKPSWYAV